MFIYFQVYAKKVQLDSSLDLRAIAASCNGYVGADLESLVTEATISAVKRSSSDGNNNGWSITPEDFDEAKLTVRPSTTRGITVEIPNVSWDDIGGLHDLKVRIQPQYDTVTLS